MRPWFNVLLVILLLSGCATTGPKITSKEIEELRKELEVKAFLRRVRARVKVTEVGVRIIKALPEEERKAKGLLYTGMILSDLGDVEKRAFHIRAKEGVLIAGIVEGSPAHRAGLMPGDVILAVDGERVRDVKGLSYLIERLKGLGRFIPVPSPPVSLPHGARKGRIPEKEGKALSLKVLRGENILWFNLLPELLPERIDFAVIESSEINAFATPSGVIGVTYGMLRFVDSDDELAVVMGHEVAHLVKGHIIKSIPTQIIAILLGTIVQQEAGTGGEIAAQAIRAPFSREFEREADYFGLLYAHRAGYDIERGIEFWERFAVEIPASLSRSYLSTHPSSPERLLRVIKTVKEIKGQR